MAIQSSGADLQLSEIQTEFGGSNPIGMSEYYAGGDNVPSSTGNVPSSGEMQMSDFYGAANVATLSYSGGVSEVVATDNSSTTVSTSSHMVMGLSGRSNGQGGGNMGGNCSSVNCNNMIQIKVRSKAVHGASGALSRGTVSEVGPTNVGSGSGCQINVWGDQACSSNKFLVGIRVNSIPHSFTCNWYGNNQFQIYRREATFGAATHGGSTTYSSSANSSRNAYGSSVDLGSNRFGTGYSISTGSSGEYTDNQGWAWFGYRVFGQHATG
jgi:hypothetical protein